MDAKKWGVPAVFLALPFMFLVPGLIWKSQLMFFLIMPAIIAALSIENRWVKAGILYAVAWQIAIFLVTFNTPDPKVVGSSLSMMMAIGAGAILYKFVTMSELPTEKWWTALRWAVIAQIVIAVPQIVGVNPFMDVVRLFTKVEERLPGHLVGTLGNRNYLAAFIAYAVPAFIGWKTWKAAGRTINLPLIGVMAFLFFCFSPGTLAAFLALVVVYSWKHPWKKRLTLWAVGAAVAAGYTAFYVLSTGYHLNEFQALPSQIQEMMSSGKVTQDWFQGDVGRFMMWFMAISKLLQHWGYVLFGYGPGAFWGRQYPIHGEYVSILFNYGMVGLVILMGYIVSTWRFLAKKGDTILIGMFAAICLDMVGNFPLQIATTAAMICVICGLIERERLKHGGLPVL